jgi:Tfp pilus assembly protein PilF
MTSKCFAIVCPRNTFNGWLRFGLAVLSVLFLAVGGWGCAASEKQIQQKGDAKAHYSLGIAYLNEDQVQMAYVEFQKALPLNPKDKNIHYALGYIYNYMERFTDAVLEYQKALGIDPDFAEAHNGLGAVYAELLRWDDAASEYRKALANARYLTPQKAHFNLGRVYFSREDYGNALLSFQSAAKIQPDEGLFHFWIGRTDERLGQMREAVTAYQEAARRLPDSGEVHFYLGEVLMKSGQRREAVEEFKKVVALVPNSEMAENAIRYIESMP